VQAGYRGGLYLLLAPYLLGVAVLIALPAALSAGLAFTAYDGLSAPEWRGLPARCGAGGCPRRS
jgi:ABC-type sugar transport system permease subunit